MDYIWLLILSAAGFILSAYLYRKKKRSEELKCLRGTTCNVVIESKYSTIFGIDNTVVGMLYFALVFFLAVVESIYPAVVVFPFIFWGKLLLSGGAAFFSLVLVQFVILEKWCEYCLTSSAISIAIFLIILL